MNTNYLSHMRRILGDASSKASSYMNEAKDTAGNLFSKAKSLAGSAADKATEYKAPLLGGAAAAGAAAAMYDKAFELGRQAYRYGRRAIGVHDMVENADPDSAEAKHRRRVIDNAQRKALMQLSNNQIRVE